MKYSAMQIMDESENRAFSPAVGERRRTGGLYPLLEDPRTSGFDYGQAYAGKPGENAPGAGTDTGNREETITIPDVITVHTWFFRKYRLNLYGVLSRMVQDGEMERITGVKIRRRRVTRDWCDFPSVSFYENTRNSFIADVKVFLRPETDEGLVLIRGVLTWLIQVDDDGFTGTCCGFRTEEDAEDRTMYTYMSPFLIPYIRSRSLDTLAVIMWDRYMPEALTEPDMWRGEKLARRMGLEVRYAEVCDEENQRVESMLFFAEGEVMIRTEENIRTGEPGGIQKKVTFPKGTILVNTKRVRREHADFAIFHECIHWEKHYLFFRLQDMWNNDLRRFKTRTVRVRPGDVITDPFYWMERQANRGAYALMMPEGHMRRLIHQEIGRTPDYPHMGYVMEHVIRELRKTLGDPYFRIRARMIQLGYTEAKGAANFVDGHWIEPFAFSEEALGREEYTFVISREEERRMREECPGFRELMQSGTYVYADGRVVQAGETRRNTMGMEVVSAEAGARADQYCLRFVRVYEQRNPGRYVAGRVNFDADYARRTSFFLRDTVNSRQLDELDAKEEYINRFPKDFRGAFDLVMHQNGMTREKTAEKMNLTPKTLYRMLKEPEKYVTRDFVVTMALIWQMPDWLSELMMDRAGLVLREGDKRHRALKYILRVMWMDGVGKANEYLESLGMDVLYV